ncbi:MAG: DUF637 domain-containing protein, partial [Rickettsiales bacterium]|nr:DUF637 domain-containing protein [Rickettsiales bacterium]
YESHTTFGGDIGKAALGGAITGLATGLSVGAGKVAGQFVGSAVGGAVGGSAGVIAAGATSAAVNATVVSFGTITGNAMSQATLNGGNFGDVLDAGWKSATSSDTLKSVVISAAAAGITTGLTDYIDIKTGAVVDSTGKMTGGVVNTGNQAGATLRQQLTTALYESAISTTTNTALQSAVNGDSFSEALQNQVINTVVMAGAKLGANAIGSNYHTGEINKVEQLTLHAGLGATVNLLTGNDALSGAVSGVVGELAGEVFDNYTNLSDDALKEIGGLAGGLSAIITSKAEGLDVSEISNNAYSGQRIGHNAVENNLLYDIDEVVEAVSDYREAKDTMNNAGDGESSSSGSNTEEEYSAGEVTTDDIKNLMTLNDIANGMPSADLDILPDGTIFMDGESSLIFSSDGVSLSIERSLVTMPDPLGVGTIGIGNGSLEFTFNTKEISVGGSFYWLKETIEMNIDDNLSGEIEINYGGGSVKVSTETGAGAKYGLDVEAHMKYNIKN